MRLPSAISVFAACILLMSANPADADSDGPVKLKSCPSTPNCVSSRATIDRHKTAPLPIYLSVDQTMQILKEVIASYPRSKIIAETPTYLHAEFRVNTGFTDDVEFLIDEPAGLVHVRSASRIGYWDFGANRKRVEKLRRMYAERIGRP